MSEAVPLARDFIRHGSVAIRITSSVGNRFAAYQLTSRYIRLDGMILEVSPPIGGVNLLRLGETLDFRVKLPHREEPLFLKATVLRLIPLATDPDGALMTVAGMKFIDIANETRLILEAHELSVAADQGIDRSPRIPVRFPVDLAGMDVMSPLYARDLSMTGMFVGGKVRFTPGKILNLQFKLPFQQRPVSIRGKVVWHGSKSLPGHTEPCAGFGLQFVEVPPASRAAIATYYARNTVIS